MRKSIKFSPIESLAVHALNEAKNLAIADAQRIVNEALAKFNSGLVEVLAAHNETLPENAKAKVVLDPKTNRPVSLDWDEDVIPQPPQA